MNDQLKIGDQVHWEDNDAPTRPKPPLRLPSNPHEFVRGSIEPAVVHRGRIVGFEEGGLLEGSYAIVDCGGFEIRVPLSRLRKQALL